mgnify:CR=1 FL=1
MILVYVIGAVGLLVLSIVLAVSAVIDGALIRRQARDKALAELTEGLRDQNKKQVAFLVENGLLRDYMRMKEKK